MTSVGCSTSGIVGRTIKPDGRFYVKCVGPNTNRKCVSAVGLSINAISIGSLSTMARGVISCSHYRGGSTCVNRVGVLAISSFYKLGNTI